MQTDATGNPPRILLTGATGFVGRQVVAQLAARGVAVHAVGRHPAGNTGTVSWHALDLFDVAAVRQLLQQLRPTHLLHLAWYVEHGRFWTSPENLRWVEASLGLVREFHAGGGERCVLAGTCAEYAWGAGDALLDERLALRRPATFYGVTKESLRQVLEAYGAETGLGVAWGEIFSPYGPGEPAGRLVPSVISRLLRGEEAPTTHGEQWRDFIHVQDLAAAFIALLESRVTGAVNLGSGEAATIADVVRLIGEITGRSDLLRMGALPARVGEPRVLRPQLERLHREVGWQASIPLREGLSATVEWWRNRAQPR